MKKAIVVEIISILFIFLFIYAATSKLMDVEKFRIQVGRSPLITKFTNLIIWLIPALELILSILLILEVSAVCFLWFLLPNDFIHCLYCFRLKF